MKDHHCLIEIKHLYKSYPEGKGRLEILNDLNLSFTSHGLCSLLGNSGSGKTTLLNVLSTLDSDFQGEYLYKGCDVTKFTSKEKDNFRNKEIGFIFQESHLLEEFTVEENILLVARNNDQTQLKEKVKHLLEQVHLTGIEKKKAKDLSGGEKQRISIVRALINDPEVLIADEPTGSLDNENGKEVMEILKNISQTKLVIVVTHNQDLAESYSDRILKIKDGKIHEEFNHLKEKKTDDNERKEDDKTFSFSFKKLLHLSTSFLFSKKAKTSLVSSGSAISILGLGLVLSASFGFKSYSHNLEGKILSQIPLTIEKVAMQNFQFNFFFNSNYVQDEDKLTVSTSINDFYHLNTINEEFTNFINNMDSSLFKDKQVTQSLDFRLLTTNSSGMVVTYTQSPATYLNTIFSENTYLKQMVGSEEYTLESYDLIAGSYPTKSTDLVLVLAEDNAVSSELLTSLGLDAFTKDGDATYLDYEEVLNKRWSLVKNDDYYVDITDYKHPIEESAIYLKRDYDLRRDNLSLLDIESLDFNIDKTTREYFEKFLPYVDIPRGVTINLDEVDFNNKDEVRHLFLSLFQTREHQVYRTINDEEKKEYLAKNEGQEVRISGILKVKKDAFLPQLPGGIYYLPSFLSLVKDENSPTPIDINKNGIIDPEEDKRSNISKSYENNLFLTYDGNIHLHTRTILNESIYDDDIQTYLNNRQAFGVETGITGFYLYPKDFASKERILNLIDQYNLEHQTDILPTDLTETIFSNVEMLLDIIMPVLIVLSSVSIVVAMILTASILYSNVLERTKEIGLFRALGASKKGVGRVFRLMSLFIGLFSGLIGIGLTYIGQIVINAVLSSLMPNYQISSLFSLPVWLAFVLLAFALILSYLASLIPSYIASKKDPILALKEE